MTARHPSNWLIALGAFSSLALIASRLTVPAHADVPLYLASTADVMPLVAQTSAPSTDFWYAILKEFGLPTAYAIGIGCALGGAIWKMAAWFDVRVAQPMVVSHTGLIEQIKESNKTQTATLAAQAATLEQMADSQKQSVENQSRIANTQEKIFDLLNNQCERRAVRPDSQIT